MNEMTVPAGQVQAATEGTKKVDYHERDRREADGYFPPIDVGGAV